MGRRSNGDQDVGGEMAAQKEEISFQYTENYCVSFVDIVDSTRLALRIKKSNRVREFYSTYINGLSSVVKSFNSIIVKNTGDCLIYYFPATSDSSDRDAFKQVLDCGFATLAARSDLNRTLESMNLPPVSYRISCDYGKLEVGKFSSTQASDLFGSTMNICAKINCMAYPNTMVVGGDLYQILKSLSVHHFEYFENGGYSLGLPTKYPVYIVGPKKGVRPITRESRLPEMPSPKPVTDSGPLRGNSGVHMQQKKKPKIMIVDDEPDILLTFRAFLHSDEFEVETFNAALPALKRFTECVNGGSHFDLAVLDIRMPGINGLQLHQRFRHINRSIKTIFVSGLDVGRELVTILPEPREIIVIKKPVSKDAFSKQVKAVLNNHGNSGEIKS